MKSDLMFVVAGIACLITFFVVRRILKERLKIGPPGPLTACIAAMAFLGLCGSGDGLVAALLIPYATLALTLLLLCLLCWLSRCVCSRLSRRRTQDEAGGRDSGNHCLRSSGPVPSSEPPSTRLRRRHVPAVESSGRGACDSQTPPNDATRL